MKWIKTFSLVGFCLLSFSMKAGLYDDDFCGIKNRSFQAGEEVTYTVYYSLAGLYVSAGKATFSNTLERMNGRTVYHVVGDGSTNSSYEWMYKVKDRYESYIDTATLQPLKFIRNIHESDYKKYENITFNRGTNTAITTDGVFKVPDCIQDVISSIYYSRNIDFGKYKVDDKIPF